MSETRFNIKNVLAALLVDLQERSRDVIVSRFGIGRDNYETLEAIGKRYGITRERVRQIESDALKHIKSQEREEVLNPLLAALSGFVKSQGGVMEEEALRARFTSRHFTGVDNSGQYRGMVSLLLSVGDGFKRSVLTDDFSARWFISGDALKTQEKIANHVVSQLKSLGSVVDKDKLFSMASSISSGLNKETVFNYLAASRSIEQNVFGQWGLTHWAEIKPRGVKDKAYLVMKQSGKPLHFRDVAEHINDNDFSARSALAQTVHNELIKDSRFILVGRGLYALKEWGYKEGTVKDVIKRVLVSNGPMVKNDLVNAVLKERFVKPSTVILNLNSFKKSSDNKYTLV